MLRFSSCRVQFALLTSVVVAVGCGKSEQIRSYAVPKETATPPVAVANSAQPGEPTDRMLAAIVPDGERAWFYKLVGPIPAVEVQAEAILKFMESVPAAGSTALPGWKLPEGWSQQAGDGIRLATIRVPAAAKPLEITVNTLPWRGSQEELLSNVNRWRGQMNLPDTTAAELEKDAREVSADGRTITIVDLRGRSGGAGMMPPFAGRGGPANMPLTPGRGARGEMPAGHPPIGGSPAATKEKQGDKQRTVETMPGDPKFTIPDSWKPLPASQFLRYSFRTTEGGRTVDVSISDFDANSAPAISDPLQNVNRWRTQNMLPTVSREEFDRAAEKIEIDGRPAIYVALMPDTAQTAQSQITAATLGAMLTVDGRIWYFKMRGDRDLVAARQAEFKAFLKSVKFAGNEK